MINQLTAGHFDMEVLSTVYSIILNAVDKDLCIKFYMQALGRFQEDTKLLTV